MTPAQLLEEVKGRFTILYHDDETALVRMLRQALGKFQTKAGAIRICKTNEKGVLAPSNFLSVAICHDDVGRYIAYTVQENVPENMSGETPLDLIQTIILEPRSNRIAPYSIHYFLNLREWNIEMHLPNECISLVSDYLEALIDIPNTERHIDARTSTHLETSHLSSIQELKGRLVEIEIIMEESKAMIPPVAVY